MVEILIDGRTLCVAEGTTVLGAARLAGIDIPHFCYHPAFPPEGSCRMCLVEIEGQPKLELACSTVVRAGLKILTASPQVVSARRDVLELFLAEHPLDCPICDKAGECLLQDYYEAHGRFSGRFREAREKREKLVRIGRRLLLDRERCVLCTRCVRFLAAYTGTEELGVVERGVRTEIGTFEDRPVDNSYSGNLVDLCPVGAITAIDFRFRTRTWFLERKPSLCPKCGRGCNIFVDIVCGYPLPPGGRRLFRIRPRENPDVNGYWICDIGRYAYLAELTENRRTQAALVRYGEETPLSMTEALGRMAAALKAADREGRPERVAVVLNSSLTNEELARAREFFVGRLGVKKLAFADPLLDRADGRLLTAERCANARGAAGAGFAAADLDLKAWADGTDCVLLFGSHLLDHQRLEEIQGVLAKVKFKALFAAQRTPLDGSVDIIVPVSLAAEKEGHLTNVDGRVQPFKPVWPAAGDSLAEGAVFDRLREELG
jgi:NADH-quinone oxidoreductase subunit G